MTIDVIRETLGWCCVINTGLVFFWFLILAFAHDAIYRLHGKWFEMSKENFNSIHYAGMTFFKMVVFVFNIVPYIALRIAG